MKYIFCKLFIVLAVMLSAGPAQAEGKLYLYVWDTYVAPDLFQKFQQETGIEVIADVYDSNDALMAKLKAGVAYDIVAPSGNYVPLLIAANLLKPLPGNLSAYGGQMVREVQNPAYDSANVFTLPLFYGSTGLAVNTNLTSEKVDSWHQYFVRPAGEKPALGQMDEISSVMDIASLTLGKSYCDNTPETLKALQELLLNQKPFVKTYSTNGYIERLTANEVAMQIAWNGDVYKIRQENPAIQFIYPKEGVELWTDNLAIPAQAEHVEAAEKFIDFVMRPENAAEYAKASGYMSGLEAAQALMPEEMRTAPEFNIPPLVPALVTVPCKPETIKAYGQIWERLMQ